MNLYLLKSTLCLLVMLTAYRFFLEKEKMHRFKRAYLLFSLLFSFIVPLIPMAAIFQPAKLQADLSGLPAAISRLIAAAPRDAALALPQKEPVPVMTILLIGYCLITSGFLFRFIRNLYLIRLRITANRSFRLAEARVVLVREEVMIHTFYKTIFINESYGEHGIEREILRHELTHVRQLHTIDILLLEVLQVFFWFNPLLILYKRAIQLNHEFLADEGVIEAYQNPKAYQHLLLNKLSSTNHLSLSSPLNYKITKKRLVMMTTPPNTKSILVKKMAIGPLLLGALFLFSNRIIAQQAGGGDIVYINPTVAGSDSLGAHPFVLIDNKEYPSDMLKKISPSCIRGTTVISKEKAIRKYGPKAADGAVIITTAGSISYITATERENQATERMAKKGFYQRVTLKNEDGTLFDKLIITIAQRGMISAGGSKDCKVGFLVGSRFFTEDQVTELERVLAAIPKFREMGVGGDVRKHAPPGLDLSSYEVIFYFDPTESTDTAPKEASGQRR